MPPPQVYAAPPPAPRPPPPAYPPVYAAPAPAPEHPRFFGLVFMPGVSSKLTDPHDVGQAAGALAIELRPSWGGARLRLGVEGGQFGRVAEVALKYDFFEPSPVKPFLSVSAGAGAIDPDPVWRFEGSVGGGIDLYATRDFFFTFEVKERWFANRSAGVASGLEPSGLRQTAFYAGLGIYL
jgi:hypothetical protein